jgi:hypothetical protein
VNGYFFTTAGGVAANHVAKWDGSSWSALGSGMGGSVVYSLTAFDDGSGPALYAGGIFTTAGGVAANYIAQWDGSTWSALGSGMGGRMDTYGIPFVFSLTGHDDGSGPALYAGGEFSSATDSLDSYLAKWACDATPPVLSCPSSVFEIDAFGPPIGEVVTFSVTATDNLDPSPSVVCVPPSGSLFPRGTTLVTCTATDASGNESTCEFLVTVQIKAKRR